MPYTILSIFTCQLKLLLVKILLKTHGSYLTEKQTDLKMSRPKVNMSTQWDSSLGLQTMRYSVDHLLFIKIMWDVCEWEYFSLKGRKSPGLVTSFLTIYILNLYHTYWLFWTPPELWREIKPVDSFKSQFRFKQNDQNCLNLFFSPLNLLARQC